MNLKHIAIVAISSLAILIPLPKSQAGKGDVIITPPLPVKPATSIAEPQTAPVSLADEIIVQTPAPPPAPVQQAPVLSTGVTNCGDNFYKQFIYKHESGCRTNAINPIGACGLGQALPCSKMGCGLDDFACQDAWFSNYASKYGGWAGAYAFWLGHSWW